MKNIDRIRQMSVDEMVEWIIQDERCGCIFDCECDGSQQNLNICRKGAKQWLESESEE